MTAGYLTDSSSNMLFVVCRAAGAPLKFECEENADWAFMWLNNTSPALCTVLWVFLQTLQKCRRAHKNKRKQKQCMDMTWNIIRSAKSALREPVWTNEEKNNIFSDCFIKEKMQYRIYKRVKHMWTYSFGGWCDSLCTNIWVSFVQLLILSIFFFDCLCLPLFLHRDNRFYYFW